ncbi:response regulator [Nocardia sp. CDC160]|uniref:response regulator n=1 Tax=Nocardia sp. CDC160 TaxID=3112166 RepID=UPI002DBFD593|nr:response regulator [Nocardia sp. CDC160]MEC3914805.1 response regulator [Nocardia sp. CDC160]
MITVLVVDDDFRVAQIHAGFVAQVDGFRVIGQARTAAEARAAVAQLNPDLVLLDLYLPDESGIALLTDLGADVIVATAANDRRTVSNALARGALNYLIKPFDGADLVARLHAYARYREHLAKSGELTQTDVDRACHLLHLGDAAEAVDPLDSAANPANSAPATPVTVRLIARILARTPEPMTTSDIAEQLGFSRTTAQRYLSALAQDGRVEVRLRYGTTGRPEHLYNWNPRYPVHERG